MTTRRTRALVVYPHLPHYRFGVFRAMAANTEIDYVFAADVEERTRTIETIPFDRLPVIRLENRYLGGVLWQRGLLRVLRRQRADVVIFLGDVTHLSTWLAAVLLRLRGTPVLFWTIGWHRPEQGLKRSARLSFYRLAQSLLVYGNEAIELGAAHGYPRERMVRVGNSRTSSLAGAKLGPEQRATLDAQLEGVASNAVASVVRLNPSKRLDLLIEAAGRLQASGVDLTLLIAGDGPERRRLDERAIELGVDARFLGPLYAEEDLSFIYERADVTVLPSAGGLTVIQSLEHGTPVITHDNPHAQMPEAEAVRRGVTGDLYRENDVSDLAEAMQRWFGGRARTPEVARACREEVAALWSPESHERAISDIVKHLVLGRDGSACEGS